MIYTHDLDPILFHLGPLAGTWYGLMYALGFMAFYFGGLYTTKGPYPLIKEEDVASLFTYSIIGLILGGRFGYVLFYGDSSYLAEPWRIFQTWKGGMSFHGGLLGVTAGFVLFARNNGYALLRVGDFAVPWIPIGLFLGRIGNFINGELYGKPTDGTWGVIFPGDSEGVPRHPSQLYEAALEGLVLLLILQWLRIKVTDRPGLQPAVFLIVYGIARTLVELVRVPDAHIGYAFGWMTRGMMLSIPMVIAGVVWVVLIYQKPPQPLEVENAGKAAKVGKSGKKK